VFRSETHEEAFESRKKTELVSSHVQPYGYFLGELKAVESSSHQGMYRLGINMGFEFEGHVGSEVIAG